MNRKPIVSVILTTFNRDNLLPCAINSVLQQTFNDFELLIIDDFSQDQTPKTIKAFSDNRIKYIRHAKNLGLSAARNTGITHAIGEYIAFLDDDDEWLPSKIEKQVRHIQQLPESFGLVYCWMDYYEGNKLVSERHPELRGDIFKWVLENQPLGNGSTFLLRRSAINNIGYFDETLNRGIDGDFLRRICLKYKVDFIPEVLVKYNVGHSHKRITSFDEQNIRNALKGEIIKLVKFKKELSEYPKQASNIFTTIATHYDQLNDKRNALNYYMRAIMKYPFSAKVYIRLLSSLGNQIRKKKSI
ncbi:MAG: glycosyltransferase family 2 protein [Petrotogales bacterium]